MLGMGFAKKAIRKVANHKFTGRRSDIDKLEETMRYAETNHILTFAVVLCLVAYELGFSRLDRALWLMTFNILYNVYPIMLQWYNRVRISSLVERVKRIEQGWVRR